MATHRTRALIIAETGTPDAERQAIDAGIRHRAERLQVETDAAKRRGFAYGLAAAQASSHPPRQPAHRSFLD